MSITPDPSTMHGPWIISNNNEDKLVSITEGTKKLLKDYDILAVDFLYQTFKKRLHGVIINEENDMNAQLQVSVFLGAVYNTPKKLNSILVIARDDLLLRWNYHLSNHGGFKVKVVTKDVSTQELHQVNVFLLSFTNLKLASTLVDYEFLSVVLDDFDEIANKMAIKKLCGNFKIGISHRNFYMNPDQKLFWTMINWSNPGCVGKLADFYEIDKDNFANSRDNYRHWWFRLTWNFCDTFKKPTEEEKRIYKYELSNWASSKDLMKTTSFSQKRTNTKRKFNKIRKIETVTLPPKIETVRCTETPIHDSVTKLHNMREISMSSSSNFEKVVLTECENDILLNIIKHTPSIERRDFNKNIHGTSKTESDFIVQSTSNYRKKEESDDDSILLSLIGCPDETKVKKIEVPSYHSIDIDKKNSDNDIECESDAFLRSLVSSTSTSKITRKSEIEKANGDNVDGIIRDTEELLHSKYINRS